MCALEIKSSRSIGREKLSGLRSFLEDNPGVPAFILGISQTERLVDDNILIIDWRDFFEKKLESLEDP